MLLDFLKTIYNDDFDIMINDIIKSMFQNNKMDINKQDKDGRTPLMLAIINKTNDNLIKELIDAGADLNKQDKDGRTPLMLAIIKKNDNLIKAFINAGADINKQDNDGNTALMLAIIHIKNDDIIKYIIEAGVDVNKQDNSGNTALILAIVKEKNDDIIQYIIDAGSDLNKQNKDGDTALMYAVGYSYLKQISNFNPIYAEKISKKLIDAGADINKSDFTGWTALMYVSRNIGKYSTIGVLNLLIKSGANLDLQEKDGRTALMIAAKHSKNRTKGTVKMLIDAGADINKQDKDGNTALMLAAKKSNAENTIKMIINVETDFNIILNANIPKCNKDKILKNIIGHISITQYRTFVDIFHYDISLLKPVKQKLLDFCRSLYLIETNDIKNNWPVSIVTSNLNNEASYSFSERTLVRSPCLVPAGTRTMCVQRTHNGPLTNVCSLNRRDVRAGLRGPVACSENTCRTGLTGAECLWVTLIHKYNHILEELFQNDPECVNFFSLMYME